MPNPFFDNPRTRRLRRDLAEMKELAEQSSVLTFSANGDAPDEYEITFRGKALANRDTIGKIHEISIHLGMEYPRTAPQVKWKTEIFHPNIRGGNPCFGTFAMNPNVRLVDVVEILWDMARLAIYNSYGGYGDKDIWQVLRKEYDFPIDKRILRDKAPVVETEVEKDKGEADLTIMGRHQLGSHLPPSQQWVKMALEQFFDRRDLGGRVELYTADEWAETGQPRFEEAVGTLVMDQELYEFLNAESEEAEAFRDQLWRVFKKLGVLPNPGMGNILPLLPMRA